MHLHDLPASLLSLLLIYAPTICRGQSTVTITQAASTSPPSPSYTDASQLRSSALNSTNFYRSQHNASAVSWNSSLASTAASWASNCQWRHSGGPTGENLAQGFVDVTAAVDAWAGEQADYNYNHPGFSESTGHFTQLVWRNTTTVGCAATGCNERNNVAGYYLVCEYWPPGNIVNPGEFQANVRPQVTASSSSGTSTPTTTTTTSSSTSTSTGSGSGSGSGAPGRSETGSGWWALGVTIAAVFMAGGLM